jgi:Transposase IS4
MFPASSLMHIVRCTNKILQSKSLKLTSRGEIVRFIGVVILATKYEFTDRAKLWSNLGSLKYEIGPPFGRTGRKRK